MIVPAKSHYRSLGFNIIGKDLLCAGFYSFAIQNQNDNKIYQILVQEKFVFEEVNSLINLNTNLHFALNLIDYQLIKGQFISTVWEGGNLVHVTKIQDKFKNDQQKILNYIFWAVNALLYFHNQNIILNVNSRYFYELDGRDVIFPVDFSIQGELATIQLQSKNYLYQTKEYKKEISKQNLGQTLIVILCNQQLFKDHGDMIGSYKGGTQYIYKLIDQKCQNIPEEGRLIIKGLISLEVRHNY
ncbi:hypothetical protein pb186bvf_001025 [Paramecium bursaria]